MSIREVGEREGPNGTRVIFVEVIDDDGAGKVWYEAHCDNCELDMQEREGLTNLGQFEHLQDALNLLADHECEASDG